MSFLFRSARKFFWNDFGEKTNLSLLKYLVTVRRRIGEDGTLGNTIDLIDNHLYYSLVKNIYLDICILARIAVVRIAGYVCKCMFVCFVYLLSFCVRVV